MSIAEGMYVKTYLGIMKPKPKLYGKILIDILFKRARQKATGDFIRSPNACHLSKKTGFIRWRELKRIEYMGELWCWEVKTQLGYALHCDEQQKLLTPDGYVKLRDLNVGDMTVNNGRTWCGENPLEDDLFLKYHMLFHKFNEFEVGKMYKVQPELLADKIYSEYPRSHVHKSNKTLPSTKGKCLVCGKEHFGVTDHYCDGDIGNDDPLNKISLCIGCHNKVHRGIEFQYVIPNRVVSIEPIGKKHCYHIMMNHKGRQYRDNTIVNGFITR